jgi:hypothetical protein
VAPLPPPLAIAKELLPGAPPAAQPPSAQANASHVTANAAREIARLVRNRLDDASLITPSDIVKTH